MNIDVEGMEWKKVSESMAGLVRRLGGGRLKTRHVLSISCRPEQRCRRGCILMLELERA